MSEIINVESDLVIYPKIILQNGADKQKIKDENNENIVENSSDLKINTEVNNDKNEKEKVSPSKSLKNRFLKSKLSNSLLSIKRKSSKLKLNTSKSSNNFLMTALKRNKDKKNDKENDKENITNEHLAIPNSSATYGQPSRNNKNSKRISSKLSISSSPAESSYFTDASSTHSFFSSFTTNSIFSALCKKKTGKKLKRKDFSEKIKDLGSGATGNIQLVYRKDNPEKYYALKEFIIPKHKRSQEDERKFFKHLQTEYTIGTLLHHRNVVEVENFIYNDYYKRNRKERHIYQVMEYCNGGDLFDAIQSGNMSQGSILCCFKQLMEGLAYIHSMGVAHLDLKPENIMFKDNKILKILDFGASVIFRTPYSNKIIRSSGIVGSEPYMAPEQFSLKPYDPRTVDIWSCGIIFLAMFYNELPWKSAILSNLKYKAWAEKGISEIITDLPKGPRELITRMLEPNPGKRITIEEIFKDPWFKHIYCCQDHESGILDCSRYNYSTMSYSPSAINSSFRRPSDEMQSNTSYTGRTLKNKGSSIRFSDGVLSSDNSMTMSDTSDSSSILKNNFSNSSEKTKVGDDNQSTNNEMNITKKAIFSIDTESDEDKDSDSPVSSSDIIKDNSDIVKEKEQKEEIGKIEEENEEELKTYWGLDLKCSHEMT